MRYGLVLGVILAGCHPLLAVGVEAPTGCGYFLSQDSDPLLKGGWSEVELADLDADGDLDAVVDYYINEVTTEVLLNDGHARFVKTGQDLPGGTLLRAADFDGDGVADLFIAGRVFLNDGHASFVDTFQAIPSGYDAAVGDLDGDGSVDILAIHTNKIANIYLNDGAGTFTLSVALPTNAYGAVLGDFNSDGSVDIYLGQGLIYTNDGAGQFFDSMQRLNGYAPGVVGDLNGDGHLDLCTSGGWECKIFLNDGYGMLTSTGSFSSYEGPAQLADVDGDGDLDIYTGYGHYSKNSALYLNDGAGRVTRSAGLGLRDLQTTDAAFGDLDGDGDQDLFVGVAGTNSRVCQIYGHGGNPHYIYCYDRLQADRNRVLLNTCAVLPVSCAVTASVAVVNAGDPVVYYQSISNANPFELTGILVSNVLPASTFPSHAFATNLGPLDAFATTTFALTAMVDHAASGIVTNLFSVTARTREQDVPAYAQSVTEVLPWPLANPPSIVYVAAGGLSLYPYTNWLWAATNVMDAFPLVGGGGTLLMSDGVYRVTSHLAMSSGHVVLASVNGPRVTTLDGGRAAEIFVQSGGTCEVRGVTFRGGNRAVSQLGGRLHIAECIVTDCEAPYPGAAIYSRSTLLITDSAIVSNNITSRSYGGGVHVDYSGTVTLVNCTISGNQTHGYGGAGLAVFGQCRLDHCTVVGNAAYQSPLGDGGTGGGFFAAPPIGQMTLQNTIVAGNQSFSTHDYHDGWGVIAACHYSLIGVPDDFTFASPGTGNLFGVDVLCGPLQDNGGPTDTHALLPLSPAVNAGDPSFAPPPDTDQRGMPRVLGGRIDIGAYELWADPTNDADGDGLFDATEVYQQRTDPGAADTDADGQSDGDEVIAGVDPRDGSSAFVVDCTVEALAECPVISWASCTGRLYTLEWAARLDASWSALATDVPGTGDPIVFTNCAPGAAGVYRARVRMP